MRRMNVMARPGGGKIDFEPGSLAVSTVNGGGMGIAGRNKVARASGLTAEQARDCPDRPAAPRPGRRGGAGGARPFAM